MTPTSDERREAAARLRALAHDNQGVLEPMRMRHVMEEGTRILGTVGLPDCAHVLERYADLIDPTCRAVTKDNLMETEGRGDAWAVCSGCGALLAVLTDGDGVPRYCPGCGARVVDDDDARRLTEEEDRR